MLCSRTSHRSKGYIRAKPDLGGQTLSLSIFVKYSLMENPEKPCADKLAFNSKKEAKAAATTLEYQRGTKLKAYECRYCNLWHLSSQQ
jgi:hypothetical protein